MRTFFIRLLIIVTCSATLASAGEGLEVTYQFDIDKYGGKYMDINEEEPFGRFEHFLPLVERDGISKLTLVPMPETQWDDAFLKERDRLIEVAREHGFVFELKMRCVDFCREDGTVSYIYDGRDKEASIRMSKESYETGEEVAFTVFNKAEYDKYFQVVGAQKFKDGKWELLAWNVPCGCDLCDYVGLVEAGGELEKTWSQSFIRNGCEQAAPGRYRLVIEELRGVPDNNPHVNYYTKVVSNEFTIISGCAKQGCEKIPAP